MAGCNFAELVRGQLAHFRDLIGPRIELKGPSLPVSASAAQILGMAIHELATNAGKYGALSDAAGRVAIAWGLERDDAGGETFTISWREQGGPPVSSPSRNGFGSTVVGALAESSLDAKVDLDFSKKGLSWRLHCPAAGVIEGTRSRPAARAALSRAYPSAMRRFMRECWEKSVLSSDTARQPFRRRPAAATISSAVMAMLSPATAGLCRQFMALNVPCPAYKCEREAYRFL